MRTVLTALLLLCGPVASAQGSFPSYHSHADLSPASPGALRFGLYGYDNPALLALMRAPDAAFIWNAPPSGSSSDRWGVFAALPHLSFGAVRSATPAARVTDYRLGSGWGTGSLAGGVSWGWASGDRSAFGRTGSWTVGLLFRPDPRISVGAVGTVASSGSEKEAVLDVGIRPLGTELVTLFGDYALARGSTLAEGLWSGGLVAEPLPGIRLTGRYFHNRSFSVGLGFSLAHAGFSSHAGFDRDARRVSSTYGIRVGSYDRNLPDALRGPDSYLALDLNGDVRYRRYLLFDDSRTLLELVRGLEHAAREPSVAGVALGISGMRASRAMLWELRRKLTDLRESGKKAVVFLDRAGMDEYHLASAADCIVMDPLGILTVEGYAMGRTFLKGTLEKAGIGFEELRYFAYKSANENLAREKMSEADREQRTRLVEEFFRIASSDICTSRGMTPAVFERIVNEEPLLNAARARALDLVDTLARWQDMRAVLERIHGGEPRIIGTGSLGPNRLPRDAPWGEPPRIALIYALGVCAMDEGINARSLAREVEAAASDSRIRAIVLRVDSPGGDALAADYVAEALRKARKEKPVVVSQGQVAASGGYWLSMYADTIVATPGTITGSIGVIAGWLYNRDLKEKLGMSTDLVKVGRHADLGFGFTLPLLGVGLPDRNLTVEEKLAAERLIREMYGEFVTKVAAGRRMHPDSVERHAQGRVWSGADARERGLVDLLGGLEDALETARSLGGIGPGEEYTVVEFPSPGLLDLSRLVPGIPSLSAGELPLRHLLLRLEHNGRPLPILPLEETEEASR
ncbi:MAG: signal peptide peptidase SppA [Bacteroidota bacterium]